MTAESRFDRQLPGILEDLYVGPSPDYRDEVLATATAKRQRPAWTFPGRWLPMTDMTEIAVRPVNAPRLPVRAIGVALLIVALLLAALAIVGSRAKVPSPFGIARNGIITWAMDGDILVGDPVTGTVKRVVATDDIDRNPRFSHDGTHLAFLRQVPTQTGQFDLVVARSDGNAPKVLTPVPVTTPEQVEWAPDGTFLLVNEENGNLTRFFMDGSSPQTILQGVHIEPDAFRPPDGAQILYERDDDQRALYVMNLDATNVVQLFGARTSPCVCGFSGPARWSPDGKHVAFAVNIDGLQQRIFTIGADGNGFGQLAHEGGLWSEADPTWSPDGRRIAFNRWQGIDGGPSAGDWSIRPIAIVDAQGGVVTPLGVAPESGGALIEWAPDGRSIMSLPATVLEGFAWSIGANGTVAKPTMLDLETGGATQIEWSIGSVASWQRQAP